METNRRDRKDTSLANFGQLEICRTEKEMHGLMACRARFGQEKPLRDVRIAVSLLLTVKNAVLIETLIALGAKVHWCSFCHTSTEDHIAAALTCNTSLEIWRGKTLKEHWNDMYGAFDWGSNKGPDLILDNSGYILSLIQAGFGSKDVPIDLLEVIGKRLIENSSTFTNIQNSLVGIAGITSGVERLYGMEASGSLLCPALDVTKSQFDKCYDCLRSLPVSLMKATSITITGTVSVVCGYGDVGKVCAAALKQAGSEVVVSESDPICVLQALREGLQVVPLDDMVLTADIFVNTIEKEKIIMVDHMMKMKENAIVCNMSRCNSAIDIGRLEECSGVSCIPINSQIDKWFFLDTKSTIMVSAEGYIINNLGYTCRHPLAMSCSLTNQVIALIELWDKKHPDKKVYPWTKDLDKRVADLHIEKLGVKFTEPRKGISAKIEEEATQRTSELSEMQDVEQIMRDGETREHDLGTVKARITKLEEQSQVGTLKLQLIVAEKEKENLKSMFDAVLEQANDKVQKAQKSSVEAHKFSDLADTYQGGANISATAAHNSAEDAKTYAADAKARLDELVGRAVNLQQLNNVKTWVKALLAMSIYLLISVLVCMSSATSFGTVKPNTFSMSFYFVVVSMTTTGFGDIVPDGVGMKILCCLMVLTGYCGLLGYFLGRVWEVAAIKVEEKWWKDINEIGKKRRRFWYAVLVILICVVTWVILIGTLKLKKFNFWESLYFSIMILTTTGYGDYTFKGKGKIFPSIWLLVTTFIFNKCFPIIFSEFSWSLILVGPAAQPVCQVPQAAVEV